MLAPEARGRGLMDQTAQNALLAPSHRFRIELSDPSPCPAAEHGVHRAPGNRGASQAREQIFPERLSVHDQAKPSARPASRPGPVL